MIAAINSVIGAYYYLRVIIAMYFWEPSKDYTPTAVAPALSVALFIAASARSISAFFPRAFCARQIRRRFARAPLIVFCKIAGEPASQKKPGSSLNASLRAKNTNLFSRN